MSLNFGEMELSPVSVNQVVNGLRLFQRDVSYPGKVLLYEDFRSPSSGMYNDGASTASCSRDNSVKFNGKPTMRLDPQGINGSAGTPPTIGPNSTGIVFKRRIANIASGTVSGRYGISFWMRFTSANWINNTNGYVAAHIYNRDGTNNTLGRVWLNAQPAIGSQNIQVLDGTSQTYSTVLANIRIEDNSHTYDPQNVATTDTAGAWHYCKLIVDFDSATYISVQWDEKLIPLTNTLRVVSADGTPAFLHFGFEVNQNGTAQRFVNIAEVVGTIEK